MKFKLKNFKLTPQKIKESLNLAFIVIFTSLILLSTFIALPKTEQLIEERDYNLVTKGDLYWKKEFIIQMEISKDSTKARKEIEQTKNSLHRRLNGLGVEEVRIYETSYTPIDGSTVAESDSNRVIRYLKVIVKSSQDEQFVETLLTTRNSLRFYIPKDGVDFNDPENAIAPYLIENYEATSFTRDSFRNVLIKKLPTSTGDEAYFAIFKPWPHRSGEFNELMQERAGSVIGVKFDDFISPYNVSTEFLVDRVGSSLSNTSNSGVRPEFSIGISADEETAKLFDLLYNSGNVPVQIDLVESADLKITTSLLHYADIAVAFVVAIIVITIYLYVRRSIQIKTLLQFVLSIGFVSSLWIGYLKIDQVPVDLEILLYQQMALTLFAFYFVTREREQYVTDILMVASVAALTYFSEGYVQLFSQGIFVMVVLLTILSPIFKLYLNNMSKYLLK